MFVAKTKACIGQQKKQRGSGGVLLNFSAYFGVKTELMRLAVCGQVAMPFGWFSLNGSNERVRVKWLDAYQARRTL
jgi:hypothetical protein